MKTALNVDVKEEHRQIRENCGWFSLDDWCLISACGKDVFTYLQTQTTNDIHALAVGQGQNSAIVDRMARMTATFSIHRYDEYAVLLFVESALKDALYQHLDSFLFREDVTLENPDHKILSIQGPWSARILQKLIPEATGLPEKPNDITTAVLDGMEVKIINKTLTGEEGFILCCPPKLTALLDNRMDKLEPRLPEIHAEALDTLRVEAGVLRYAVDFDEKNVLPETGLEHSSVSYNKGCYVGQEVIARIKTYGAPNFAMMGVILDDGPLPPLNQEIRLDGKKIGRLKSSTFSPSLGKNVALAYIHKDHRSPDIDLNVTFDDCPRKIRTTLLPFFQTMSCKDHSNRLLHEALALYKDQEDLNQPIALLREAIELDAKNTAAYEALGVFLSRQNNLDEAIAIMKRLLEINPSEIMAHTNLSIYYMKQGRIEEAEYEKGEATAIQFEKAIAERMNRNQKQAQEEEIKKERTRKIEMFQKVLEIDPVDQIANFGLGSIYLETERYEEALAPLRIVVAENKDYSAAYLLLGKTLQKLSRNEEAVAVYRSGIAAASKKGDLMPLKDMQTRLNQILHSTS